jgi:hypothetical protein
MTALGEHVIIEIPDKGVKLDIVASALAPPDVVIATADLSAGVPSGWTNRSNPGWVANAVTPTVANGQISIPATSSHYAVFEAWPVTGLTPGDKLAVEFDYDAPADSRPFVGANTAADLSGTWFGNEVVAGQVKTKQRVLFTVPAATTSMWILLGNNVSTAPTATTTVKFSNIRLLRPFEVAVPDPQPQPADPRNLRVFPDGNFYHPNSYLRVPLLPDAPLLSNSAACVTELLHQMYDVGYQHPDISIGSYTPGIFFGDKNTPRIKITSNGYGAAWGNDIYVNEQLASVPAPPGFKPSPGTDAEAVVIELLELPNGGTDYNFYEIWGGKIETDGSMTCRHGSRLGNNKTDVGYYTQVIGPPRASDGQPSYFAKPGVTGAALPFYPLMISAADLAAGVIDHPLGLLVISAASTYVWPAQATDGGENVPIKEGMCFRFPVSINFDTYPGLSRLARMIGKAIQKWGMYIYDRGDNVGFRGQNPMNLSPDPWWGPGGALGAPNGYDPATFSNYWPPAHLGLTRTDKLPWTQLVAVDPRAGRTLAGG